jgi:hypothetical protein
MNRLFQFDSGQLRRFERFESRLAGLPPTYAQKMDFGLENVELNSC